MPSSSPHQRKSFPRGECSLQATSGSLFGGHVVYCGLDRGAESATTLRYGDYDVRTLDVAGCGYGGRRQWVVATLVWPSTLPFGCCHRCLFGHQLYALSLNRLAATYE